jgi:hypothetical protein
MLTAMGKVLKKKTAPKTKVTDSSGNEWQVVDQRKTQIVEVTDSDEASDSNESDD